MGGQSERPLSSSDWSWRPRLTCLLEFSIPPNIGHLPRTPKHFKWIQAFLHICHHESWSNAPHCPPQPVQDQYSRQIIKIAYTLH